MFQKALSIMFDYFLKYSIRNLSCLPSEQAYQNNNDLGSTVYLLVIIRKRKTHICSSQEFFLILYPDTNLWLSVMLIYSVLVNVRFCKGITFTYYKKTDRRWKQFILFEYMNFQIHLTVINLHVFIKSHLVKPISNRLKEFIRKGPPRRNSEPNYFVFYNLWNNHPSKSSARLTPYILIILTVFSIFSMLYFTSHVIYFLIIKINNFPF